MSTQKLVRDANHCVETLMGYLGLQDATGKWRPTPKHLGSGQVL